MDGVGLICQVISLIGCLPDAWLPRALASYPALVFSIGDFFCSRLYKALLASYQSKYPRV